MSGLLFQLRLTTRTLRKSGGVTVAVVSILAIGIAANTAIFSAVRGVLLRPLPYSEPDRILQVWETDRARGETRGTLSPLNLIDWQESSEGLEAIAGYMYQVPALTTSEGAERLIAVAVTPSFFDVLGVAPAAGRVFRGGTDDATAEPEVILGNGLWQNRFGGDPSIVGSTIRLDGEPHTVIGVMPASFRFPRSGELWMPLEIDRERLSRGHHYLFGLARLAADVELAAAQAEMDAIAARLEQQYPETNEGQGVRLVPLMEELVGAMRLRLWILLGAVTLLLLSACANVANLLLVRATSRQREVALRTALGATRRRLLGQFLLESVMLAGLACGLGIMLAYFGLDLLLAANPFPVRRADPITIDGFVLGFAVTLSLAAGLLFGTAPAWQAANTGTMAALKEVTGTVAGQRRGQRLRRFFVVSEIALAVVLLAGAGLLTRSFVRLSSVDPGFQPRGLYTLKTELSTERYREPASMIAFADAAVGRLAAVPGVDAAAVVDDLPFSGSRSSSSFEIEGRPDDGSRPGHYSDVRRVSPDYFRAIGLPLLRGRGFDRRDTHESTPVAVVSSSFAARFFPGEEAIGQRIRLGSSDEYELFGGPVWREIVGVVGDIRHDDLSARPAPEVYRPLAQGASERLSFVVRARPGSEGVVPQVRAALRELDPYQPVFDVRSMQDRVADSISVPRFHAGLVAAFGVIALLLAALGIYGVVAYSVAQRTREIGVRLALGAEGRQVRRLMVGKGAVDLAVGLAAGLAGAAIVTRVLTGVLFEVRPLDPATYAAVTLFLGLVGLLASYLPARRAARVDPLVALRHE